MLSALCRICAESIDTVFADKLRKTVQIIIVGCNDGASCVVCIEDRAGIKIIDNSRVARIKDQRIAGRQE